MKSRKKLCSWVRWTLCNQVGCILCWAVAGHSDLRICLAWVGTPGSLLVSIKRAALGTAVPFCGETWDSG